MTPTPSTAGGGLDPSAGQLKQRTPWRGRCVRVCVSRRLLIDIPEYNLVSGAKSRVCLCVGVRDKANKNVCVCVSRRCVWWWWCPNLSSRRVSQRTRKTIQSMLTPALAPRRNTVLVPSAAPLTKKNPLAWCVCVCVSRLCVWWWW
jgi:hypothetical protein